MSPRTDQCRQKAVECDRLAREPDFQSALFVESAVVTERREKELQRFGFDEPGIGDVIDNKMGKVRLTGNRAECGELWRRKAHNGRQYPCVNLVHGRALLRQVWRAQESSDLSR